MVDMLTAGVSWLSGQLQGNVAVQITYTRKGLAPLTLTATPGTSLLKVTDPSVGARVVRTDRDYIFPAASLVLGGNKVRPAKGDTITETLASGNTETYTVLPYSDQEPVFRYSDHEETIIRVRTKRTV